MILSLTDLRKNRPQEQGEDYTLVVPELTVRAGEKILITGPSGSGKSTFLDLLGMVLRPDRATRFLFSPSRRSEEQLVGQTEGLCKGQAGNGPFDIARAWQAGRTEDLALWRRHVGYVLQTGGLLPFLRVSENIALPRRLFGLAEGRTVVELAEELNIAHLLNAYPARLSVGERQRVAIARALAAEPSLVLADEPTAALDPEHSEAVTDLFMRMVSSRNLTLILVTHAPEQMRGKDFRRLHITQQGQGVERREAVLLPAPAEHTSSLGRSDAPHSNSTGRSNSAPETWLKERVEELRTIPERDFGMELAENHSALPQEEEPSLAELAALAALAQISGIATSQDMRELTDETQPSDWMRAQTSWRGIDEDGEPIFSDESGNRRGTA